jgi:hypothetical protein
MNVKMIGVAVALVIGLPSLPLAWGQGTAMPPDPGTATPPVVKTTNCIDASQVERTIVLDDQNILYVMATKNNWRNHLEDPCHNLGFQRGFVTKIEASTICKHQLIHVINDQNMCFLGDFIAEDRSKQP